MLGLQTLQDLQECFLPVDGSNTIKSKEACRSIPSTSSSVLLSAVYASHGAMHWQEASATLAALPNLLQFVMEEDVDEVLRSVLLEAVFCLAKSSMKTNTDQPGPATGSGAIVPLIDVATAGLQVSYVIAWNAGKTSTLTASTSVPPPL